MMKQWPRQYDSTSLIGDLIVDRMYANSKVLPLPFLHDGSSVHPRLRYHFIVNKRIVDSKVPFNIVHLNIVSNLLIAVDNFLPLFLEMRLVKVET